MIWSVIDGLDMVFFKICFVQISSAAIAASIELFICLKVFKSNPCSLCYHLTQIGIFFSSNFFPHVDLLLDFCSRFVLQVSFLFFLFFKNLALQIIGYCAVGQIIEICVSNSVFFSTHNNTNTIFFNWFFLQNGQMYEGIQICISSLLHISCKNGKAKFLWQK